MSDEPRVSDEIFPKNTNKTYSLVEVVRGEGPMVGKGPDDTVFSFPIVLLLEIILLLGVTLLIFLFSLIKHAPLETIANPLVTTNPAKAPWYFMGLQEMLEHMHPLVAGVLIPTILVLFLIAVPYIDHARENAGVWFSTARGKRIVRWVALYAVIVMPTYIIVDSAVSIPGLLRDVTAPWIAQGVVPALIIGVIVAVPTLILIRRKVTIRELMLGLFTLLFVSAIIFTMTGFFFRGPGFKLYWPWAMPNGYNPLNGL